MVVGSYGGKMSLCLVGRKGSFKSREELRKVRQLYEEEVHALHRLVQTKND
jgi:hypothetical protein